MKQLILVVLLAVILTGCNKPAQQNAPAEKIDAVQMEKDMWAHFTDTPYLEKMINNAFQSSHPDGARDKAGEIKLIQNLNLGKYTFADFKATQNDNVAIVTYSISVAETIDGKELSSAPAQRLSVWQKTDKGWQWMAHANLNPLVK